MSDLVELVAEAIWNADLPPGKPGEPYWRAHMEEARAAIAAIEASGYRIVKDVEDGEAIRPGFDERSYEVGYMEGENSARADQMARDGASGYRIVKADLPQPLEFSDGPIRYGKIV